MNKKKRREFKCPICGGKKYFVNALGGIIGNTEGFTNTGVLAEILKNTSAENRKKIDHCSCAGCSTLFLAPEKFSK